MKNDPQCYSKAFINACLRRIIEVLWPDTISNEQLGRGKGLALVCHM